MRRFLAACLALVLLASPVDAITRYGDETFTRLWSGGAERRFMCTATYIDAYGEWGAWVLTAAHCTGGVILGRDTDGTVFSYVNWRGALDPADKRADVAVGTAPDPRPFGATPYRRLGEAWPERGTTVYVHGFPEGVERIIACTVIAPDARASASSAMRCPKGAIQGGSSGSAILDESGRIVGVLWGHINRAFLDEDAEHDIILTSPVERVHELLKLVR